jgi:LAO/AO transport system kinase
VVVAPEPTTEAADALVAAARDGDRSALARLLSQLERGGSEARAIIRATHPLGGHAYTVGLTGAPGAGKSTLTARLVARLRRTGDRVAVLAIDPSSPFTGGAILGDRVRMQDHDLDAGVFIRSMATRGHLGGLALATPAAVRALDAAGFPWVVLETVGVGQVEVEVAGAADTTVVVLNPGWGDAVQAAKAGLLEIADVFVLNKADRPGAGEAERDLVAMLGQADRRGSAWVPPVVRTVATSGEGAHEVVDAVHRHRDHLEATGELTRRREERAAAEVRGILIARLLDKLGALEGDPRFDALAAEVAEGRLDPWTATDRLLGVGGAAE